MNDRQRYLFKMLCEIDDICAKHGIQYFLHGGTLLGAVRNEGFLPWDDDVDIAMPHDEFLRFAQAFEADAPAHRVLREPTLDPTYRRVMPRYMSTETTALRITSSLHDDAAGETIDIFLLDPIADGEEAWERYRKDLYLYHSATSYADANGTRAEFDPRLYAEMVALAKEKGQGHVNRLLEKRLSESFSDTGEYYAIRWKGFQGPAHRSWFSPAKTVMFEQREFQAPSNACAYLNLLFGEEWFQVPHKINPAKHSIGSSLMFPYTEALDYYRPRYDRTGLLAECEARKIQRFSDAKEANAMRDEQLAMKAAALAINLERHIDAHRGEFDAALATRDAERLSQLLGWYLDYQTSRSFIGRPYDSGCYRYYRPEIVPVAPDVLDAALLALLATSRVGHARRLLAVARDRGLANTPLAGEIDQAIDDFHACVHAYEDRRFTEGLALATDLARRYPSSIEFHLWACIHLQTLCEQDPNDENLARLAQMAEGAAKRFPEEGGFIKFGADALLARNGNLDEAIPGYLEAAECTDNGLVLHAIAKQCGYHPARIRTKPWAKAAQVPQWHGDEPTFPNVHSNYPKKHDPSPVSDYLFGLLMEATTLLEANHIEYAVSPSLARSLFLDGTLPEHMASYALFCDHQGLLSLVNAPLADNRAISYMGNDPTAKSMMVRYHGTDSFHLSPTKAPARQPGLFVSLVPLEPASYPPMLDRQLRQWIAPANAKQNRKRPLERVRSLMRRMTGDRMKAGSRLFERAAGCDSPRKTTIGNSGQSFTLPLSPLESTSRLEFGGGSFKVPTNLEAYAAIDIDEELICPDIGSSGIFVAGRSLDWFAQQGHYDYGYPEKWASLMKRYSKGNKSFRKFRENFEHMKIAVLVKEQSLELLPRKNEIADLRKQGNLQQLKPIIASYASIVKKHEKRCNVCFDDEILEAAKWVLNNADNR